MDWEGTASWAFLCSSHLGIEVLNVGRWLTHGDLALDTGVDFLAVVEHRLIPARVRSQWSRLRRKDLSSIWAPASQVSSHVGNAGVGVVSLRGAPISLPTFATAQFRRFFDCGRALRCLIPLGSWRFMHLVVLNGYQGADVGAEQLALTEQLLMLPLVSFVLLLGDSLVYWLGISTWSPPKSLAWQKGFRLGSGLIWRRLGP